jgi:hypothetical protein
VDIIEEEERRYTDQSDNEKENPKPVIKEEGEIANSESKDTRAIAISTPNNNQILPKPKQDWSEPRKVVLMFINK